MKSNKMLSFLKMCVLPKEERVRYIPFGLYKGLKLNIDFSSQTQLYLGLWERETYKHMNKLAKGINSAVDIGAAYGEQTLYFAKKTSAKKVFSFEPQQSFHPKILSLIELNNLKDKTEVVLSDKFVSADNTASSIRIEDLLPELEMPCLIKIDIDGGEVSALQGAVKLLKSSGVRWLIETHSYKLEKNCIDILRKAGYTTQIIYNAWWRIFIPEQRPSEMNRWLIAIKRND